MDKLDLIFGTTSNFGCRFEFFNAPEHKEATYTQCLRNYAACLEDLPEDELLVTSDCDMAVFKIPEYVQDGNFSIVGFDLVPQGQFPQCYITAPVKKWREAFNLNGKTYQQAIDDLLGEDECEHYRACRWSVDQEQSYLNISKVHHNLIPRSNGQNQFAMKRVDRTDLHYKDRLDPYNLIDAHLWRPGYTEENFPKILELLQTVYPNDGFDWLVEYTKKYRELL
jgi:hypothetical protein